MAYDAHANLAYSLVATAPAPAISGTTLSVTAGQGALFPAAPFNCTVWAVGTFPITTNAEIIRVTSKGAGDNWTIVRAQEGTAARTILVGDQIANTITAKVITDIETSALTNLNISAGTTSNNLSALTFSNSGNVSFGLNGSTVTATATVASTQGSMNVSAGTTSSLASAFTFSNSNNVSFGINGATITATASVASTQASVNLSAGTTSSLASAFTFSNSNNVSFGMNGATITATATVAAQTNQTAGLYAVGNTTGQSSSSTFDARTISFSGAGNVSVGYSGGNVLISGGTAAAAPINFSAGTTSSNIGSVVFSDSNRVSFGLNGSTITAKHALNFSAGTTSNNLSDGVTFSNSNNVSFGLNGSTITATATVATSLSNIRVSAGTTSNLLSAVTFSDLNGVSWGLNASTITASIATSLTNIRISAGTTSNLLSAVTFSNSNNVSFGMNGSTVTATATVASSQGSVNLSAGTTSSLASAFTFSNSNNVSFGINGATITATATVASSQGSVNISAGTTSSLASAFTFSDSNRVSFGINGATVTAKHALNFSAGTTSNNISDGVTFSNSNNVSFGINGSTITATATVASSQGSINLSAGTTSSLASAFTFSNSNNVSFGINGATITATATVATSLTNINVSAGTTSNNLSAITFSNSNNITFGLNASTLTASYSQSNQTIGAYALGNTTGQSSSTTFDARTVSISGAGNVSVGYSGSALVISGGTAAPSPVNFSAGTTSNNLGSVVFSDSNGVSWGLNGSTITATVSTYSTVGTATTVTPVASANSVGTVTRWAAEDHRHAGIGGLGISTAGNSSGTSGSQVGTYWLQGGSNITISQITSNNGSHTAIISGAAPMLSMWPDVMPGSTAVSTYYSGSTSQGAGGASTQTGYTFSLYAVPMPLAQTVVFSELRLGVSNTRSAGGTGSVTQVYSVGIYSNNASTLSLVDDYYAGLAFSQNSVTAQTYKLFTLSTGSNSVGGPGGFAGLRSDGTIYSSQGNISANSQMDGAPGVKLIRVDSGAAFTLTAGQYYCVLGFCSVSSSSNVYANVGIWQSNAISSVNLPDLGRENSTQTSNWLPAWGAISTTFTSVSNAATFFPLPNAINIANLTVTNSSGQRFHFPYLRNNT